MKSNAIIRIVIWSIVLASLLGVLGCLLADELYLQKYDPDEVQSALPVQTLPSDSFMEFSPDSVREIEIAWVAGDVVIISKDVDFIRISESDVSDSRYAMAFQTNGSKLEISFCEETMLFGLSLGEDVTKDLYIEVPKDWEGKCIEVDAAASNIEMQNITVSEMDIDGAAGVCDFRNCHISDLDIDAASGDVYYQGTLDMLDFDAASASFTGELDNTPNRIDMDGMSGVLDIALPEDCGYNLTVDGMSSRFASEFQETESRNQVYIYGDGRCRINVDGMSCDVKIRRNISPVAETITE